MPTPFPGAIKPAIPYPLAVPLPVLGGSMVTATFDEGWLPYLIGVAKVFTAASTWDPPTAEEVYQTIVAAYGLLDLLSAATPAVPATPPGCGCDCEDCMQLRFHNCVLQQFDCITQTWVDVPSDTTCVSNPAPGGGILPPGAGVCQDYVMQFQANALTPLPFHVNTGDTIQVNQLKGAGSDGTLDWYCPDGSYFIAGACAGGEHLVSTDPLATSPHMSIVLKIGSTYYPFTSGTFTIPSGIANIVPYIGVNDATIGDDAGTYTIDINYCNNQATPPTTWCRVLDFTLSPGGLSAQAFNNGSGDLSAAYIWSSGVGWVCNTAHGTNCACDFVDSWIELDMGANVAITSYEVDFEALASSLSGPYADSNLSTTPDFSSGNTNFFTDTTYATGVPVTHSGAVSGTGRYVRVYTAWNHSASAAPAVKITKLKLSGTGVNPFGSSNC